MIISPSAISPYKIPTFQSGGGGFDPDALAFITAAGITGATQQAAIIQLVANLKGTGSTTNNTDVWSDLKAIYPYCPIDDSTATRDAFKYNLINPLDTDAAFRIDWFNSPTAAITGITGNGTNQYGNTHFKPLTELTNVTDASFGFVSRTNSSRGGAPFGCNDGAKYFNVYLRNTSTVGFRIGSVDTFSGVVNNSSGVFITTSNVANEIKTYQNNNLIRTYTNTDILPDLDCYLLANNSGTLGLASTNELSFTFMGAALTVNQAEDLYDAITTYNTSLGR